MKQKLESLGWTCALCSCPGKRGYDCANGKYPGIVIAERKTWFRIFRSGVVVESANASELDAKMQRQNLI